MAEPAKIKHAFTPATTGPSQWNEVNDPTYRQHFHTLRQMICMRLHLRDGDLIPFEHLDAVRFQHDKVVVFVVTAKGYVVIEDDWALFPTDALITKLNLLRM